ncbi:MULTISPECIES: hypothetical protein [Bacillus cereus group]|uniref:Uncharacterized protein n=1 Tax=Bacillus proteolyticus TaxID=2026192 RepID=A0ABV3IAL8_9BACI|nr:hypothetical protein [Bacillus cereus group sp. N8]MBJ8106011.1 hypothetical protein [Bacillus cereus group sp. N8]
MSDQTIKEYAVVTAFRDKFSDIHYSVGDLYKTDDLERIEFLQEEGFLDKEPIVGYGPDVTDMVHVGGGYYELPNGEKIKGKEAALEALRGIKQTGE